MMFPILIISPLSKEEEEKLIPIKGKKKKPNVVIRENSMPIHLLQNNEILTQNKAKIAGFSSKKEGKNQSF